MMEEGLGPQRDWKLAQTPGSSDHSDERQKPPGEEPGKKEEGRSEEGGADTVVGGEVVPPQATLCPGTEPMSLSEPHSC